MIDIGDVSVLLKRESKALCDFWMLYDTICRVSKFIGVYLMMNKELFL